MHSRSNDYDCLIVGGGHGGGFAALQLRKQGFSGSIGLLTAEPYPPYERPPLTKNYLLGKASLESRYFHTPQNLDTQKISLHPGTTVTEIDPAAKEVNCQKGEQFGYKHLIWAAGGRPRQLDSTPGHTSRGIFTIRSIADVDALLHALPTAQDIVIVGAGYIGLEVSAALVTLGKRVTVVQNEDRVLSRVTGRHLSEFLTHEHETRGVRFMFNKQVAEFEHWRGKVSNVRLIDDTRLPADIVIVGIGIDPVTGPLEPHGLATPSGVTVDQHCRTRDNAIFAIGDCALFESRYSNGQQIRIESVQNAQDQAAAVAKTLAGMPTEYDALPTFWSDQFDLNVQSAGLAHGADTEVIRGDRTARSFSILYFTDGTLIAIDAVNATKDFIQARKLIRTFKTDHPQQLANSFKTLRELSSE